ncbi:MAG TPA: hypothetical protein VGC52_00970, partial [Gemmatimonadaceae bacterium]
EILELMTFSDGYAIEETTAGQRHAALEFAGFNRALECRRVRGHDSRIESQLVSFSEERVNGKSAPCRIHELIEGVPCPDGITLRPQVGLNAVAGNSAVAGKADNGKNRESFLLQRRRRRLTATCLQGQASQELQLKHFPGDCIL